MWGCGVGHGNSADVGNSLLLLFMHLWSPFAGGMVSCIIQIIVLLIHRLYRINIDKWIFQYLIPLEWSFIHTEMWYSNMYIIIIMYCHKRMCTYGENSLVLSYGENSLVLLLLSRVTQPNLISDHNYELLFSRHHTLASTLKPFASLNEIILLLYIRIWLFIRISKGSVPLLIMWELSPHMKSKLYISWMIGDSETWCMSDMW